MTRTSMHVTRSRAFRSVARAGAIFGSLALLATIAPEAFAFNMPTSGQSLGNISSNVTTSLRDVNILGEAVAMVAGFFMGLIGLFKFKAHKDNPQQTPFSTPLWLIGIGVCMIALPAVFGTGMQTIWGGSAEIVNPW